VIDGIAVQELDIFGRERDADLHTMILPDVLLASYSRNVSDRSGSSALTPEVVVTPPIRASKRRAAWGIIDV
jgi:hypothetical protein